MANAKLCDTCTGIFPEGQEGSESGVARITVTVNGRQETRDVVRDTCAECASGRHAMRTFRPADYAPPALEGSASEAPRHMAHPVTDGKREY